MAEPLRKKRSKKGTIGGTAEIAEWNLRTYILINPGEQVLAVILDSIKLQHPRSRASSLRGSFTGRYGHMSDVFFHIDKCGNFIAGRKEGILRNHGLRDAFIVPGRTHVAKRDEIPLSLPE